MHVPMPDTQSTDMQSTCLESTVVEMAATAQQVGHLYEFLASLYRSELTQQQLQRLRAPEMTTLLSAAGISLDGVFWNQPPAQLVEQLAVEYAALFLGPGGHISPHESVQIEEHGGFWGDATTAVRRFITGTGIEYSDSYTGIPDHISVELEFLAELAKREGQAWQQGDAAAASNCLEYQQAFLQQHLGAWIKRFSDQVIEMAELSFYRELARVTTEFVDSEKMALEERLRAAEAVIDSAASVLAAAEPERLRVGGA